MATLIVYCGNGPYWDVIKLVSSKCRANWWTNLLYINNLVRFDPLASVYNNEVYCKHITISHKNVVIFSKIFQCMKESWYLACDMQYYLISPFLVYPIWRWGWTGLWPLITLLSASLVANVRLYAFNDIIMVPTTENFQTDAR